MTEDYKPTDNALADRVNATVKTQRVSVHPRLFKDVGDEQHMIAEFVEFSHLRCPHIPA